MRHCKWIIRETGLKCGELATTPVYSRAYSGYDIEEFKRSGKIIRMHHPAKLEDFLCSKHAKEFDVLRQGADAFVRFTQEKN